MQQDAITYGSLITLNLSAFSNVYFYSDGFMSQSFSHRSFHTLKGTPLQDFQNTVFRLIPVLNYRWQENLIENAIQDDFQRVQMEQSLKKRKQIVQSLQMNLEGELNSNISLDNKLKGTPLVFSSSTFHLVHLASLKFLALNDENLENLQFELVDFPNENTVLRFNPCLNYQKQRTNIVYSSDIVCLSATKLVCNRCASLYSNYQGLAYEDAVLNIQEEGQEAEKRFNQEVEDSKLTASLDEYSLWKVNFYIAYTVINENVTQVGDVVGLLMTEQNMLLKTSRNFSPLDRILNYLAQEPQPIANDSAIQSLNKSPRAVEGQLKCLKWPTSFSIEDQGRPLITLGNEEINDQKLLTQNSYKKQDSKNEIKKSLEDMKIMLMRGYQLGFEEAERGVSLPYGAFWKIESEQHSSGGPVHFDRQYRIRHFQTGLYLGITTTDNITHKVELTDLASRDTIFTFKSIDQGKSKLLSRESFFNIVHHHTGKAIMALDKELSQHQIVKQRYDPLLQRNDDSELANFRVRKADFEEIWETRFLLFCTPLLMNTLAYYEENEAGESVSQQRKGQYIRSKLQFFKIYNNTLQMLELLDSFVNNRLISNIQMQHPYSVTSPMRQDVILSEHVLPLLMWLLVKSFPSLLEMVQFPNFSLTALVAELAGEGEFLQRIDSQFQMNANLVTTKTLEKLEDHHVKRKLLLSFKVYRVAQELCKKNEKNQQCFSRFLSFIEQQIGQLDYVTDSLKSVFTGNDLILQQLNRDTSQFLNLPLIQSQRVDKPFLQQMVSRLQNTARYSCSHLLSFLASCCLNGENAIFANQDMIFKALLEDKKAYRSLMSLTCDKNGLIIVESMNHKGSIVSMKLTEFLDENNQEGNSYYPMQLKYLCAQITLFSALCAHRNYAACKFVSQLLSLKSLVKHALNLQLDESVRSCLYSLIRQLYVDREPYSNLRKPNLVRLLDPSKTKGEQKQKKSKPIYLYDLDEGDPLNDQQTKMDEQEIKDFLHKFKDEMLEYLKNKYDLLTKVTSVDKVYNTLTLEVIKILHMLLRFGLFEPAKKKEVPKQSLIRAPNFMNMLAVGKKKEEDVVKDDIDRLVEYLALLLEYDESYFNGLTMAKLQRKYVVLKKQKESASALMGGGLSALSGGFSSMTSMFSAPVAAKAAVGPVRQGQSSQSDDVIADPLFKKIRSLRKILMKFGNKTFIIREDNQQLAYEIQIKQEICSVFSYMMDIRQDYLIDNMISFFNDTFVPKASKLSTEELVTANFDQDFLTLFPEDMLASGEDIDQQKPMKEYTPASIRAFDQILERPFSEILLLSLYFTQHPELQNQIVDLIERFCRQKKEFSQHLEKIQLLLSPEQHQLQQVCLTMVQRIANNIQYSQVWLQLDDIQPLYQFYIDDTSDRLWKLESIFMNQSEKRSEYGIAVTLELKQSIIEHMGGYWVISRLLDKALSVFDQNAQYFENTEFKSPLDQEKGNMAAKIIKLIRSALSFFKYFARENSANQKLVYKNIARKMLNYRKVNLGQIELICDLFEHNTNLFGQITPNEFECFVILMKQEGQYKELLEFYDTLLRTSERCSKSSDMHKQIMVSLLGEANFSRYNPFGYIHKERKDKGQRPFFEHKPNSEKYTEKYLSIVARCLRKEIGVNLITQTGLLLPTEDILRVFVSYSEQLVIKMLAHESLGSLTRPPRNACDILRVIAQNSKLCLDQLFHNSHLLSKALGLQLRWLQGQDHFTLGDINFLLDSLLPILNIYNDTFIQEGTQAIMLSASAKQQQYNKAAYEFAEYFISRLDKIFFLNPEEIQGDQNRIKAVNRLADTFNLVVQKNVFEQRRAPTKQIGELVEEDDEFVQLDQVLVSQNDDDDLVQDRGGFKGILTRIKNKNVEQDDDDDSEGIIPNVDGGDEIQSKKIYMIYQECWTLMRQKFKESVVVKNAVKMESQTLSRTIWTISEMFQSDVKGDQKELLLVNEDIIVKILNYLQYWEQNKASKTNVIFILKVLSAILKGVSKDDEALVSRQMLYDRLNAAKSILVLIWDEKENEPEYLCTLMKFLILMMQGGNESVQKNVNDFFQSSSICEKLFVKLYDIMNMQIASVNSSHKLTKNELKLVSRALRILQLFCEGHFQDLQKYLYFQKNQKNSYDLVTHTVSLLSSIRIGENTFGIVVQSFESLTEMIQGPCKENQTAIGNSKFLEFAVKVLSEDNRIFDCRNPYTAREKKKMREEGKKDRGSLTDPQQQYLINLHPGKLAILKYKCLNTIVSLLECNETSDSLIMRILRTIPLNVLTQNLGRIYMLIQKYAKLEYSDSLFNRVNENFKDPLGTIEDEKDELIIENGFFIYILIQVFLSNKKGKELLYQDSEMSDVIEEFTKSQEGEFDKMFEGGLLGKFSALGGSLLAQSFGAMANLKNNLLNQKSEDEIRQEEEAKFRKEQKELTKKAVVFFRTNTCSIDMVREQNLYQIIFPKLPICKLLPKDVKLVFHDRVDRTSSKTKLTDLINECEIIIETMKHEERLRIFFKINPVFGILASHGKLWELCAFYTTVTINLMVCFSFSEYFLDEYTNANTISHDEIVQYERLWDPRFLFQREFKGTLSIIMTLGIVDLAFSSLVVFFFLVKRAPLKIQHLWLDYFDLQIGFFRRIFVTFLKFFQSLFILLQDFDILYFSSYIIANIIGLIMHPFFQAYHLVDFLKLDQLKTVIQAIWYPKVELGLAILLLLIVEYYFSILGYMIFFQNYENEWQNDVPMNCTKFWHCFLVTFDWTFKYTGSIGSRLRDPLTIHQEISPNALDEKGNFFNGKLLTGFITDDYNGVSHNLGGRFYLRFFFDNLINIFVVMIMLNMIQGIIVDTFSSLREKLKARTDDQMFSCFICGFDRQKLDKSSEDGRGFFYHIKQEHYMWNYVCYKAYLDFKSKTDYNGNESYVVVKMKNLDISWFPVKMARGVDDDEDENAGNNITQYDKIIDQLSEIQYSLNVASSRVMKLYEIQNDQIREEKENLETNTKIQPILI